MIGRSDFTFSPPKTEPFKVLPAKRLRKLIFTNSSDTEPIDIVFPFPYSNTAQLSELITI